MYVYGKVSTNTNKVKYKERVETLLFFLVISWEGLNFMWGREGEKNIVD